MEDDESSYLTNILRAKIVTLGGAGASQLFRLAAGQPRLAGWAANRRRR